MCFLLMTFIPVQKLCVNRSTWKNKEYLKSKDKAKNDMMYQTYIIAYVKIQKKIKIYYPVCQTYSPTDV